MSTSRQSPGSRSSRQRMWALLIGLLVLADSLAIWLSLQLAYRFPFGSGWLLPTTTYGGPAYAALTAWSIPLWLAVFFLFRLYRPELLLGGLAEYQRVASACTTAVLLTLIVAHLWHQVGLLTGGWLLVAWVSSCVLVGCGRFLVRRIGYGLRSRGHLMARVLIVGANEEGVAMAEQWMASTTTGMEVVGFLDDFKPVGTQVVGEQRILGRPSALTAIARELDVDEVIVVSTGVAWDTFQGMVGQAQAGSGPTIRFAPGFYGMLATGIAVTNKTFVPLFALQPGQLSEEDVILKKLLDYMLGGVLALLALPLGLLIALGLKLACPARPVLIARPAAGRNGHTFRMYLFRAADDRWANSSAAACRLERLLYWSGLDKLPQLINLLKGDMSLVGPRPHIIGLPAPDADAVRSLRTVKPGITGPWAIKTFWKSDDEDRNDLYYVRNWTIWLDLQILYQSLVAWLRADVAERRRINAHLAAITRGREAKDNHATV